MSWSEYFQDFFHHEGNEVSNESGYFQHEENESGYFQNDENEIRNKSSYVSRNQSEFETDTVFNSRQDLIDWVKETGLSIGYVIVIKRSKANFNVSFHCDVSGKYTSKKPSTKNTGTKKCDCPFGLEGKYMYDDCWTLRVICDTHNHEPAIHLEGHPYARRLSESESQLVNDLLEKNVKPRNILSTLKKQFPQNVSTLKTIYNASQKFRLGKKAGKTPMQELMSFLHKKGYICYTRPHTSSNELEDLFFAHPTSLKIWRAFPDMLLMDATYNTVRYPMPLLEIVGVTPTNQTFCIAFVFMHKEKKVNYDWAMTCLISLMDGYMLPRVIVTDRELALMKAYDTAFPNAKGLLCRWHINRSVMRKCKKMIKHNRTWYCFCIAWNTLINSHSEEACELNLEQLQEIVFDFPGVMVYLNTYWLTQYKERFVAAWTNTFLHFGNQTTNRVESQHAKLKLYLDSAQSDLLTAVSYIHEAVNSQETAIHSSLEHSKIVIRHRYNVPLFRNLNKRISLHALDILFEEYERCVEGKGPEICECQLRTSYGLPCSHEQRVYMNNGYPIPLEAIDRFWRKLDLSPCVSIGDDDLGCQAKVVVDNFNKEFKKQPRAGKKSLLRKLKEITTPSETSLNEPTTQKATGGRSSFKRAPPDQPSQTQEPPGYSFSPMPNFVGTHDFINQKPRSLAYIDQFPNMLHPYIEEVQDVRADGNCGFRAVAVGLKLHQNEWRQIRYDLMEELRVHHDHYVFMFGAKECDDVRKRLNFFGNGFAPIEKWMNMPEIGFLIASRYDVIFHNITTLGSMTYVPLRSIPPSWYDHRIITLGYVNNNHYVSVLLQGNYPMPTTASQWFRYRSECAVGWSTPYLERINYYNQLLRSNRNV